MSRGAFGYLRVSSPGQAADDRDGFARQKDKIRQWAKEHDARIMQWFNDVLPGKTPLEDRPGMQAMLGALYSDGIKLVVIERLDRLSRKLTIQESAIAYLKTNGFEIISATEPDLFDDDPMRTAMRQMMGIFSELDAKMIALKLKAARTRARTKDPDYREGRKPFGHREGEAEVIARVMELHARGLKLPAIANTLNAEGARHDTAGSGFRTKCPTLSRCLRSEIESLPMPRWGKPKAPPTPVTFVRIRITSHPGKYAMLSPKGDVLVVSKAQASEFPSTEVPRRQKELERRGFKTKIEPA